jgi:hypothetical protein
LTSRCESLSYRRQRSFGADSGENEDDILEDSPMLPKSTIKKPRVIQGVSMFAGESEIEQGRETFSPRQHLIIDEDDFLKHVAPTMRNPFINKHNILDTIAEKGYFKR